MVTKGDILYFAPGIRFNQIDLNGPTLPEQFNCRITGYYIKPAEECCERGQAFAAGVLLVSCIDALARFKFKTNDVGKRFKDFVQQELPSFSNKELAKRFYEDFRNGLIHESRIKLGGQFSLEGNKPWRKSKDYSVSIHFTWQKKYGLLYENMSVYFQEMLQNAPAS